MTEPLYIVCHNGVFTLPDSVYQSLSALAKNNFVYLRQDDDALVISTTRIADGHRRVLNTHFRSPMLRTASRLAIVDLREAIRVMPVA